MTKDSALGLLVDLGQPRDILALMGSLPGESFDGFLLECLKTSWFFVTQAHWLSIGGLLINLSVLHHKKVTSLLRSSLLMSTHFLVILLGKNLLWLYFI
jgi:hypothetical protein